MADINVPGIGNVKKGYAYAIGGGIVIIGGIAYWRHQAKAASAATAVTDTTSSTDPNAIDPSTGMPYSQETGGGSYPSYPYGVSDYGGYPYSPQPLQTASSNSITTNADWATQAENDLSSIGVSVTTAAQAISKVLAGLPVTTDQRDLFMQAVGLLEAPPQGYPTPIKLIDTPAQPSPPPATVSVPNVVGMNFGSAYNTLVADDLTSDPGHDGTHAAWTVTAQSVKPGTQVKPHTLIYLTVPKPKVAKK